MSVRAWLLDLDGTLVDTHDANMAAYGKAIPTVVPRARLDLMELRKRISAGESCSNFVPALVPDVTQDEVRAIAELKRDLYPSFLGLSRLNVALVDCVKEWRNSGGLAVLVTTAKQPNAKAVLAHHGIADLFDACVFGDGIERLKPEPDIYLAAMTSMGLRPSQCWAFEDSEAGVAAATAAGIGVTVVEGW